MQNNYLMNPQITQISQIIKGVGAIHELPLLRTLCLCGPKADPRTLRIHFSLS